MKMVMEKVAKIEYYLVAILIALMTAINFIQVVSRYVLKGSLTWSEETMRFMFIWVIFIGASIGVRTAAHLGMTFIVDNLPPKANKIIKILSKILILIFCGVITYLGFSVVLMQKNYHVVSSAMGIPMYWISIIIPVSFTLMVLHLINSFRNVD